MHPFIARRLPQPWPLAVLALLASACGSGTAEADAQASVAPPEEAAVSYPEGTAFAIGNTPVLKEDIDAFVPLIKLIDPHLALPSLRRNALANVVLPIAAGRDLDPLAREDAFQRAQAFNAHARENGDVPEGAPEPRYLTGTWRNVGLVPFREAMSMAPGSYSRLVESPAAWTFFKLVATNLGDGEEFTNTTEITIQRYDVPYLPDESSLELIQQAIDTLPIDIVDEEWESIIPPIVIYKPKAGR